MDTDDSLLLPPTLTTVSVHAGAYLAHDLLSAMPLVCQGTHVGILGEFMWERTARALQHVRPGGPYPRCDALTLFVHAHESETLGFRCDIIVVCGSAIATIVRNGVPRWRHAPIDIDKGDNVVSIARRVFAAGLPEGGAESATS
ncbi:hypothetical protein QF001_001765 [Paraburkholderia youngii]